MLELTFLGTGTSSGIPVIGCDCAVCRSADPRDKRTRTSAVVRDGEHPILIDTATELRQQSLDNQLDRVDAVLMTHAHADHTGGLDDLRRFNELAQAHLPMYADPVCAGMLRERYAYAFVDQYPFYGGKPDLHLHEVTGPFDLFGREIVPVPLVHGKLPILGYRIGDLAYVTDAKTVPNTSLDLLRNLDVLVINTLRERPHPTHLSLSETLAVIETLAPRRAYLIHLSHELGHEQATALLPANVAVAHDGLIIQSE